MGMKPSGVLDFNDTAESILTSDRLIVTTEAGLSTSERGAITFKSGC
ncbi:MAG: hypothetical protein H6822_18975 [Planctomycetaceae bacterium]|nr:hypothetical protein [Planctomycetales bacterium]MCB9924272.1 hypothetical protein [Planctomycetaceae bacterium]